MPVDLSTCTRSSTTVSANSGSTRLSEIATRSEWVCPCRIRSLLIKWQSRCVTVREFLRAPSGAVCGASKRGDRSDLKRFRLWLADARWRIRKLPAEEKMRAHWRQAKAWRAETPVGVM